MIRAFVVAVALLATTSAHAGQSFDPKEVYKIPRGTGAPVDGPADAPITVVVWSDYACGYCNRVQGTLARLELLYPGQIRWVHRTLPLDENYTLAAEVALAAAAQGRFRPMHERLFALRGRVTRAEAELVARQLGLDMIPFRAALDAHTYRPVVAADTADAEKLGSTGTMIRSWFWMRSSSAVPVRPGAASVISQRVDLGARHWKLRVMRLFSSIFTPKMLGNSGARELSQ
jgi:protein-disulfide isomerase